MRKLMYKEELYGWLCTIYVHRVQGSNDQTTGEGGVITGEVMDAEADQKVSKEGKLQVETRRWDRQEEG